MRCAAAGSSRRPAVLDFPAPIPVLTMVLRVFYQTRFSYKRKRVELRKHAVGGVMTYERDTDAGRTGYHTLWLGCATKVEVRLPRW